MSSKHTPLAVARQVVSANEKLRHLDGATFAKILHQHGLRRSALFNANCRESSNCPCCKEGRGELTFGEIEDDSGDMILDISCRNRCFVCDIMPLLGLADKYATPNCQATYLHTWSVGYTISALSEFFWLIGLYPRGYRRANRDKPESGKEPIGLKWGLARRDEKWLLKQAESFPTMGLGICLGPGRGAGGAWVIDIEGDGPMARESLARLLGGEVIKTFAWDSERGWHYCFTADGQRLLDLLAKAKATEGTGLRAGVFKLDQFRDLEFRIGGAKPDGTIKQVQSAIPPTRAAGSGKPRTWIGGVSHAGAIHLPNKLVELPEAAYVAIDDAAPKAETAAVPPPKPDPFELTFNGGGNGVENYGRKALAIAVDRIETAPEGDRNATLNRETYSIAQIVGAGALDRSEVEATVAEAGRRAGLGDSEIKATVRSAVEAGIQQPRNLDHVGKSNGNGHHSAKIIPLNLFTGASQDGEWPSLLLSQEPKALPFPVDVFPADLQAYCREAARALLAPIDFVGSTMVAVGAGSIGQSLCLQIKKQWFESALVYMALVGDPGKAKSPVTKTITRPLAEINRLLRDLSIKARKDWLEAKKLHDKSDKNPPPGEEPPQLRAIVKDVTRESLVIILQDNPRGVHADPDEVSGWLAGMNEYKAKGADRQFWLSTWSGASVSVDRKGGRESTHVAFPFVSMVGGIQPGIINAFKADHGQDDGFLDRVLFAFPDEFPSQLWTEDEISVDSENTWAAVVKRLRDIKMKSIAVVDGGLEYEKLVPNVIRFSADAKEKWVAWFNDHAREVESPDFPGRHAGAWSKMRAYAARFALILYGMRISCEGFDELPHLEVSDVEGAIKLVDYFKSQLAKVTHRMANSDRSEFKPLLGWLLRNNKETFRIADINKDLRLYRDDPPALEKAITHLVRSGVVRQVAEKVEPGKRGRKPSPTFETNPEFLASAGK